MEKNAKVQSKLELDRFEEDKAVLFTENKEIILPRKLLPNGVKEGDFLFLTIATDEADARQKEQKAKEILNEILNF